MESYVSALRADIDRTYRLLRGNSLRRWLACLRTPGVQAVIVLRFGQWVGSRPLWLRLFLEIPYQLLYLMIQICWGIELPRSARIGPGLYIGHYGGITVSAEAVIGRNCNISQGITIGIAGSGERKGVPVIGDDVYIAPGARLFGKITVGSGAKIGANTVIYKDIPENAVVVLDPGYKIISYRGNRRDSGQTAE